MAQEQNTFRAILFPILGTPSFVDLLVSIVPGVNGAPGIRPHPEIFMSGNKTENTAWVSQRFNILFGMTQPLPNPFVAFYTPSPFSDDKPLNNSIARAQDTLFKLNTAWRGEVIVAKYSATNPAMMINVEPADFPIVQNYFTRASPDQ